MNENKVLERLVDGYIKYFEEYPCDHFNTICPNFNQSNCSCTCDYDETECVNFIKNLLTNK
jgi:hypothetical protein